MYLSDLKPIGYLHVPFLDMTWPLGIDRNVLGGQLRSGGKVYFKGLGMHSTARVAYDLPHSVRAFQAELAVDDCAGLNGSVVFSVYLHDGRDDWKLAFQSEIVRGGQQTVPISVDVAGAKRIALIVDFADQGDVLDYADWLSARFVK
jgi:hypothetical protein